MAVTATGGIATATCHRKLRDRTRNRQRNSTRDHPFDRRVEWRLARLGLTSLTKFSPVRNGFFHTMLNGHSFLIRCTMIIVSWHLKVLPGNDKGFKDQPDRCRASDSIWSKSSRCLISSAAGSAGTSPSSSIIQPE